MEIQAQETIVLERSKELWNQFLKLENGHPDDTPDVRYHINAIQNIILARIGSRAILTNGLMDTEDINIIS